MNLKVIARGKVLYSEDRTHVYLGTTEIPKATKAKRFEEILDDYEGQTIIICVERPDKVADPELMIKKQLEFVTP